MSRRLRIGGDFGKTFSIIRIIELLLLLPMLQWVYHPALYRTQLEVGVGLREIVLLGNVDLPRRKRQGMSNGSQ